VRVAAGLRGNWVGPKKENVSCDRT
jgi:hypothetical protein